MKLYYDVEGGHVHCRLFTKGKNGDLAFDTKEWPAIRAAFERGGWTVHCEGTDMPIPWDTDEARAAREAARVIAARDAATAAKGSAFGGVSFLLERAASDAKVESALRELGRHNMQGDEVKAGQAYKALCDLCFERTAGGVPLFAGGDAFIAAMQLKATEVRDG